MHFRCSGQVFLRQGAQSTLLQRTRLVLPRGPVLKGSVEPKMATRGTRSAEATCMSPESLVMKARQDAMSEIASARLVWPVRSIAAWPADRQISLAAPRSFGLPKTKKRAGPQNSPIQLPTTPHLLPANVASLRPCKEFCTLARDSAICGYIRSLNAYQLSARKSRGARKRRPPGKAGIFRSSISLSRSRLPATVSA